MSTKFQRHPQTIDPVAGGLERPQAGTERMMMDWDKAGPRISRMWRKIGTISEKVAYYHAEQGEVALARQAAMFAEGCFAQATGDCEGFNVSSLKPDPQS